MCATQREATLAVTLGDPRGVGPEILVRALRAPRRPANTRLLLVVAAEVLQQAAADLGEPDPGEHGGVEIVDLGNFAAEDVRPHGPCPESGRAAIDYIERAVNLVHEGRADALVTCPISKEAIAAAGSPFPGHTEMLAALTDGSHPLMVLASRKVRVAMATTHIALREVPAAVTTDGIVRAATTFHAGLQRFFGLPRPRLAVSGLNPHCSDGGRFGDEEALIVSPAVERARSEGMDLEGPLPADTVFAQAADGSYDGVVALYHDQGMIPVKMHGLHSVVNITLGLPVIRTSVGHGTAYDIAGTGRADERSLVEAMRTAAHMVRGARERD